MRCACGGLQQTLEWERLSYMNSGNKQKKTTKRHEVISLNLFPDLYFQTEIIQALWFRETPAQQYDFCVTLLRRCAAKEKKAVRLIGSYLLNMNLGS